MTMNKFTNTAAALVVFDAGQAARNLAWDEIENDADVAAADNADKAALDLVRVAFHADTPEINSLRNCMLVDLAFMRRMTTGEPRK